MELQDAAQPIAVGGAEEVLQVRTLLKEEEDKLSADGLDFNPGYKLGLLIETPAAEATGNTGNARRNTGPSAMAS